MEESLSPLKRMGSPSKMVLDETSGVYRTAYDKLYDAAWKFDKERNVQFMKTLQSRELDQEYFRNLMRSALECKLSSDELLALMPHFDNKGYVDGNEFQQFFYRMRFDFRSKLLTDRIAQEKKKRDAIKYESAIKLEKLEQKAILRISYDYSGEDYKSAMEKLTEAAYKYDRLMPGTVQLDAFECEYMRLDIFREQLKRVFNMQLTFNEFSALVKHVASDVEGEIEHIYTSSFLVMFFRMGFAERKRRIHAKWAEKKHIEEEKAKKAKQEEVLLEKKNAAKCSLEFKPEDRERALIKLRDAARLYDKTTPGAVSMKSFEVAFMPPHVFKEQLKRVFNLRVTPAEMGALMEVFDDNGDGVVSCQEFSKTFLALGFAERERDLKLFNEKKKLNEENRKQEQERKEKELANKNAMKCNFEFTEQDSDSAWHKLTEAAWRYDKTMSGAPNLDAFGSYEMEAHIFKEQLTRAFSMKLSAPELGALVFHFDTNNNGMIHCKVFLDTFVKLGITERADRLSAWRKNQALQKERREAKVKEDKSALESKVMIKVEGFTEEDMQSALSKLTEAAIKFEKNGPGTPTLSAFEFISMEPHVFREQLKITFGVKMSSAELASLMKVFDKEGTGCVNCKDFLQQFIRTGIEERGRIRLGWRAEQKLKQEKIVKAEEDRQRDLLLKAMNEVDYHFSEADFDNALNLLITVCHQFDRRQLGPAGWAAFNCDSMTPSEFREMMKRTFNSKFAPKELGALVTYFDENVKGVVNCTAFLNSFVQIRVQVEEFKGKPDEAQKIKEYHAVLKEAYRNRILRKMNGKKEEEQRRPWRSNATIAPLTQSSPMVVKENRSYPQSAMEKLELRISVGRKSGRMDLASKQAHADKLDNIVKTLSKMLENDQQQSSVSTSQVGTAILTSPIDNNAEARETDENCENNYVKNDYSNNPMKDSNVESTPVTADVCLSGKESTNSGEASPSASLSGSVCPAQIVKTLTTVKGVTEARRFSDVLGKRFDPKRDGALLLGDAKHEHCEFKLFAIPDEIFRITKLTELWVCNNSITFLPSQIGDLRHLKILSLSNNLLENLPPEICLLENLTNLYLKGNFLRTLPELFLRLRNLVDLNLRSNNFEIFPEVLVQLPQIVTLDLSLNSLTDLPASMRLMRSLCHLKLTSNQWVEPPAVLGKMHWVDVISVKTNVCRAAVPLPIEALSAVHFKVTNEEEDELEGMLRNRANVRLTDKLRRRKKKVNMIKPASSKLRSLRKGLFSELL